MFIDVSQVTKENYLFHITQTELKFVLIVMCQADADSWKEN